MHQAARAGGRRRRAATARPTLAALAELFEPDRRPAAPRPGRLRPALPRCDLRRQPPGPGRRAAGPAEIVSIFLDGVRACRRTPDRRRRPDADPPVPHLPVPLPQAAVRRAGPAVRAGHVHAAAAHPQRRHHRQRRPHRQHRLHLRTGARSCWASPWCRSSSPSGPPTTGPRRPWPSAATCAAGLFHRVTGYSAQEVGHFGAPSLITRITNDVHPGADARGDVVHAVRRRPHHHRRRHDPGRARGRPAVADPGRGHPGARRLRRAW